MLGLNQGCCGHMCAHVPNPEWPSSAQETVVSRRVDLLYLVDSILQSSLKPGRKGCGPDGAAGQAFPRVVAAALPRLVAALASAQDGAQKAEKVTLA